MSSTNLNFTVQDLRQAIPDRCFQPNGWRACLYLVFDLCVIAGLYFILSQTQAWYIEVPVIFLIGTMLWSLFVIGHDAGHGSFSKSRTVNTFVGILVHGAILVPYRGWQRSHALHHMKTGHLQEEEVFRPAREGEDTWFRKLIFRSGIFVIIGWPMYKLGIRNLTTYKPITGSHYLPQSDLYTKSVRVSWYLGLLSLLSFLAIYIGLGVVFGWAFFAKYILAPYLIYGAWLTLVTYMQHVSPEVPVYDAKDWTRLKGALAAVDRNYGPFNWLTHNIGNLHVIHHIFPTIPHYRLREATEAVKPILGERYRTSKGFVLFDFVRSQLRCHFVVPDQGFERYETAYGFLRHRQDREAKQVSGTASPVRTGDL
ncbi:MAG: fatty acid desaturase [Pseudomonadota bacterium]